VTPNRIPFVNLGFHVSAIHLCLEWGIVQMTDAPLHWRQISATRYLNMLALSL
jgi:hypothetical protein